jgi:hypothetical protein
MTPSRRKTTSAGVADGWTPTSAAGMVDEREEDAHRRHQGLDLAKASRTWWWLVGDNKRRWAPR